MTPTPLSAFLAAVGIAAACFTDAPASAQRWRVTPLVKLDFSANADGEGTIGSPDGPLSTEDLIAAILAARISEEMQAYLIEQLLSL